MAAPTIGPKIKVASDVIRPTIDGTVSILNSALVHAGPQLESFVFTSSAAACINPHAKAPHTYTEASWNEHHEDMAAKQGEATPPYVAYPAGKVAAEKVVWTFRSTHQVCQPSTTVANYTPNSLTAIFRLHQRQRRNSYWASCPVTCVC